MSATLLPPVAPPPPPESIPDPFAEPPVEASVISYRRRLRRRLFLLSSPVVLVVLVVAIKLLSMPVLAAASQATYDGHAYEQSVSASQGLSIANLFQPWVQHFDTGAALARIGVLEPSRRELERALALVPSSDAGASCVVRTDLLLVVEQQGDAAVLDQHYSRADTFYKHALSLYSGAPEGCFRDPQSDQAPKTKKPLQDAHGRLQQKQQQAQQNAEGQQGGSSGGSSGSGGQSQGQGGSGSGGQSQGGGGQSGQDQGGGQSGQGQSGQGQSGQGGGGTGSDEGDGSSGSGSLQQLQQQDGQAQTQQQQQEDRNRDFTQTPDYSGKPW